MAAEGGHDSEGRFTLAIDKAGHKLGSFQLTDPNLYILNVLSAAVLSGATYFKVSSGTGETSIEFDGTRLGPEIMKALFHTQDQNRVLREMSVAIAAIQQWNPKSIVWQSLARFEWNGQKGSVTNEVAKLNNSLVFRGEDPTSRTADVSEGELLRRFAQFAPLKITINDVPIMSRRLMVLVPALNLSRGSSGLPKLKKVGRADLEIYQDRSQSTFSALIGSRENSWAQDWSFVYQGITFTRSAEDLGLPGLGGIVWCDQFRKNLSHSDLVEDEAYQEIISRLKTCLHDYLTSHLTKQRLDRNSLGEWARMGSWAAKRLREAHNIEEATRVDAWVFGHAASFDKVSLPSNGIRPTDYQAPLEFLLDFLHWSHGGSVEASLRSLSGNNDLADEELLVPWIEGGEPELLERLFRNLLPFFPAWLGWPALSTLSKKLGSVYPGRANWSSLLQGRVDFLEKRVSAKHSESICGTVAALGALGYVEPKTWLETALNDGRISPDPKVPEWLGNSEQKEQFTEILGRFRAGQKQDKYWRLRSLLEELLTGASRDLGPFLNTLPELLELSLDTSDRIDIGALACLAGLHPDFRTSTETDPWKLHRSGLMLIVNGRFEDAHQLHTRAHNSLGENSLSLLFLGDAALALGKRAEAHRLYLRCLSLEPRSREVKEMCAATAPTAERAEHWFKLFESEQGSALEKYYAGLEASKATTAFGSFVVWLKIRMRLNVARQSAEPIPQLPTGQVLPFLRASYSSPEVARAHVRHLGRLSKGGASVKLLARYRLVRLLDLTNPKRIGWKSEFTF